MNEDGSSQDREPESDRQEGEALKGLFAEVRSGWRDFKRLLGKVMKLGDTVGEVVVDASRLGRKAARAAARHSGLAALVIAGVGVSSPLTGGSDLNPLAGSSWDGWGRSAALALLALGLHLILRGTVRSDRESNRDKDYRVDVEATAEVARIEYPDLVLETYDETYCRLGGRGEPELVVGQRRWTRRSGFELPAAPDAAGNPNKGRSPKPPV